MAYPSRPEWERREKGSKMSVPAWLLGKIFDWSSDKDREYLRGKYEDEIRMGLVSIPCLVYWSFCI